MAYLELLTVTLGDIGEDPHETEFEPLTGPLAEPVPAPTVVPEPEKVPA